MNTIPDLTFSSTYVGNPLAWLLLEKIAQSQTLTQAASDLGLELSAASKLLCRLEDNLNFSLFEANTRPKKLSAEALELLPAIGKFNESYDELASEIQRLRRKSRRNTIRLSVATGALNRSRINSLQDYEYRNAQQIEVQVDFQEDAVLNGMFDLVMVAHPVSSPKLAAIPLGVCANLPLASPAYLAKHGTPHSPKDLFEHTLILTRRNAMELTDKLYKGQEIFSLSNMDFESKTDSKNKTINPPKILTAGYYPSLLLAIQGQGIILDIALGFAKEYLKRGELVPVLNGWHRKPWNKFLVFKKESLNNKNLMNFIRWFCQNELQASHREWLHWYKYFGISPDCVHEFVLEKQKAKMQSSHK